MNVKEKQKLERAAEQLRQAIVASTLMETCSAAVEEVWTSELIERLKDVGHRSVLCGDVQHNECVNGRCRQPQPCRGLSDCRRVRITNARLVEEIGLKEKYRKVEHGA